MRRSRIFLTAVALAMAASCVGHAQPAWITGASADHAYRFYASPETVILAYASMCASPRGRRCDVISNYKVNIVIQRHSVGVSFFDKDAHGPAYDFPYVPNFTCLYRDENPSCAEPSDAAH